MTGRISLVEQKKIQWAREKEEMARLGVNWGTLKSTDFNRTHIRTYSNDVRSSLGELKDKPSVQPFRVAGHYGSTVSLKSLATENSGNGNINLKCLDYNGGSLINLRDQVDVSQIRRRSPSLPPIFNKEQQQYFCQLDQQRDFGVEGSRYQQQRLQKSEHHQHRFNDRRENQKEPHHYSSTGEEREGETSGYASDSVDLPSQTEQKALAGGKTAKMEMAEKTWQNPYCTTPESSLPPSRRLSPGRMGELNRPRWGSVWGQDAARGDPPPPSWLSRLGQSSQVLVINHDSASSPDSSTTGSTGSDTNKTYLRGQNIPVDANILQEREARRQKALELQNAIKQQLEEKDRQRKEEKERRMREERLEDERIRREREKEKERYEEEQRILREKEVAKLKKAQAMREVLEAAERLAQEERKNRRKREEGHDGNARKGTEITQSSFGDDFLNATVNVNDKREQDCSQTQRSTNLINTCPTEKSSPKDIKEADNHRENEKGRETRLSHADKSEEAALDLRSLQVPVSKDVAIVLSGRLEDPEILGRANLQLVNLVMTPSPRRFDNNANSSLSLGLNPIMKNHAASPRNPKRSSRDTSSAFVENRLLTPSKYRIPAGRDFGTQTDIESDIQELREKLQDSSIREHGTMKDRKDTTNTSRRNVEKSTNMGPSEEVAMKTLPRSKSQPRTTLDARPRWNANRPGTRYRTQSEKDPHYQRRLRLRRRRVESSDEGSRSPSPDRRKSNNGKSKSRNANRRKAKLENYDADLSMDSLNSVVPLRIDKDGKINIEDHRHDRIGKVRQNNNTSNAKRSDNDNSNAWCNQEILSKLSSLKNIMAFQLDDLLKDDKKDANLIPDLSKVTCNSYEEFRRLKEHCPEFKIKPEKVKREDTKVRDKEFSWKATKKELKTIGREWAYGNPVPPDMRELDLQELQQVAIDWRMLTPIRPKLRQDEEMFSRLVEMGKLEAKTIMKERRSPMSPIRRSKNRAGIIESSVKTCRECDEEYCFGEFCGDILYDSFVRVMIATQQPKIKVSADTEAIIANMDRKKKKKKRKKRVKSKNRTSRKSARLLVNGKARKSISDLEIKNVKVKTQDSGEQDDKPVKRFKRKCSKYTKKGVLRK